LDSFWDLFRPEELIRYGGLTLLLVIITVESGVFFGFFLAGDSLLFAAGLLCYQQVPGLQVTLLTLLATVSAAGFLGYYIGYWFGHRTGKKLYLRKDSLFFKKSYIVSAEVFYEKYGGRALIIGRFLPVVRTFAPIFAGVVRVDHRVFFIYNIAGAILWPGVLVTLGYFSARFFPNVSDYLTYIIVGFIIITSIPVINNLLKQRRNKPESGSE
jgi:membrane-associated protein